MVPWKKWYIKYPSVGDTKSYGLKEDLVKTTESGFLNYQNSSVPGLPESFALMILASLL